MGLRDFYIRSKYITVDLFRLNNSYLILAFLLCSLNFLIFRKIDSQVIDRNKKYVEAILRNESLAANSYAISKTLVDMQSASFFDCGRLVENIGYGRVFYDTFVANHCGTFKWIYLYSESEFSSINGLTYKFYFVKKRDLQSIFLESILYLAILLILLFLKKSIQKLNRMHESKVAILEIEKKNISDVSRQVSHDVASPLSALKMMTSLLQNIDPEVKEILIKSIDRTHDIFNSLKNPGQINFLDDVEVLIDEVVKEKSILIAQNIKIDQKLILNDRYKVFANRVDLQRIISNLINNSVEAFEKYKLGTISISSENIVLDNLAYKVIKIVDNGKGVPLSILSKIGSEGFSYGKEGLNQSGSGIGLYDAKLKVKSWGGEINFYNNSNPGFTVEIKLRIASD